MRRMKDKFLRETGGFRAFESDEEFLERQRHIIKLRRKVDRGDATVKDLNQLSALLNHPDKD